MSRRPVVAGNWKMNLSLADSSALATDVCHAAADAPNVDVLLFPPFPWLVPVRDAIGEAPVGLGAQTCHSAVSGAYTGEVAPEMLAQVCTHVLVGHSERRQLFGETNAVVASKLAAALRAGLRPVLCVGETLAEREAGSAQSIVGEQIDTALAELDPAAVGSLLIAYEPVWAIGTGLAATADDAQAMCAFVRARVDSRVPGAGETLRVLYGGSVTPANAAELFAQKDIDGGLVGGASLKATTFGPLIDAANVHG